MIRQASAKDSGNISKLLYKIWEGMELSILEQYSKQEILGGLRQAVEHDNNKFSHNNILVKVENGQAAGMVVVYGGDQESVLNDSLNEILRSAFMKESVEAAKEAEEDEWYIDAIYIDERYQGRGWGTELLRAAEDHGLAKGYGKLSLNVDQHNTGARRLYERMGYGEEKSIKLAGHTYFHMTKLIKATSRF